jgi:hypothetical protein
VAETVEERMGRLEHRMDLILERLAQYDKRFEDTNARFADLTNSMHARFDDLHRHSDDVVASLGRVHTAIEGRMASLENQLGQQLGRVVTTLDKKASNWALGICVSALTVWLTIIVSVATAILSYR